MMRDGAILLVEDNPDEVKLALRAFAANQIINEIVTVPDGQAALDYLFREGAYSERAPLEMPALVLLDLKLPKVSGHEVLRAIRSDDRTSRIPVVVLTSSSEGSDIGASYDSGANSFVRKPVDMKQFVEIVRQLSLYWLQINEPAWDWARGKRNV